MLRKLSDTEAARLRQSVSRVTVLKEDRGYDFDSSWTQAQGWCVVPVEDNGHFVDEEVVRITRALNGAGCTSCFAIGAPELPAEFANAYELSVSDEDFDQFNSEFGVLRALLTDASLSWAISCNEWFNLFAGPEHLVEQMIGVPVDEARKNFAAYARVVEQGGTEGLMQVARTYS